ncbi:hypothetical protein YC2023_009788 [Brassica napus]
MELEGAESMKSRKEQERERRRVHARCHGSIGAALLTSRRRKGREIHFFIFQKKLGFSSERRYLVRF